MKHTDTPLPLITLLGPTASGKTALAVGLAQRLEAEIASADSRQVYRGMDIGTGKDLAEYQGIKYHLIDVVEAGQGYNLYQFQQDFREVYQQNRLSRKNLILCGGSGLYIEAVLKGYAYPQVPIDEELRENLSQKSIDELRDIFHENPSEYSTLADTSTHKRLIRAIEIGQSTRNAKAIENKPVPSIIFGLNLPSEIRRQRISTRLYTRLEQGMVAEVEQLLAKGIPPEKLMYYGLEYKWLTEYIMGMITYATLTKGLETAIHQFAKRQMTYFRKMERGGLGIGWLDAMKPQEELVEEILQAL